ncbi:MAG: Uma2 family endonuclease [Nocardiopsaceae bacterium]|nr:Uma2 family endonuclease [Nocardiopsaceae bacterium]
MPAVIERHEDRLFNTLDDLDVPRGYKAEILGDGGIVMSPSPSGLHQHNIWELDESLRSALPPRIRTEDHLEIRMPHLGRSVIPDLFAAPIEVLATTEHHIPPDDVLLVAEVVSPGSQERDRDVKLGIYPAAAIPLYLLIDPIRATATLYATPRNGEYLESETVTFGKPLKLPEPFGIDLDTGRFREY